MELGEKLRQARQDMGLSQRQLCGEVITRNMLSQIEHGTARPSMETLRSLASRLEKPVSYFLDEDAVVSPNQDLMMQTREAFRRQDFGELRNLLQAFRQPDAVFEWERDYLFAVSTLSLAEQVIQEGKYPYARQLLTEESFGTFPQLQRQRLLLLGAVPGVDLPEIVEKLPSLDEELQLRAEAELLKKNGKRAAELLAAAEDKENPRWNLLMGRALAEQKKYAEAANCLQKAEQTYPKECFPLLEACFRELGDYQKAYTYACKQR